MMSQDLAVDRKRRSASRPRVSLGSWPYSLPLLAVALLLGFASTPAGAQQVSPQPSQAESAQVPTAVQPAQAQPPLVAYDHGQLSIFAENATLSEVLAALHNAMGTEVDVPAGSSSERVWAHLGPGSAHRVLSDLFANTDLDYVIQGSPSDPSKIRTVTLSVRGPDGSKGGPAGAESASGPRRGRFMTPAAEPERTEPEPTPTPAPQEAAVAASTQPASTPAPATDSTAAAAQAPPAPEPVTPATVQATMSPTGTPNIFPESPQPSAGTFNAHPSPPPNMSTDQMVQQLTNMYQQRRQMQAGQSSSTPN